MEIYQMINSVKAKRGGLTRNLLTRAKLLAEELNRRIHVVTFDFNPDYDQVRHDLLRLQIINENVIIHNLYEFLSPQPPSRPQVDRILHPVEEPGFVVVKDEEKRGYHFFQNGLYVKYKEYDEDGRLKFIDFFNENHYRIRREHFDAKGRLRRTVYLDQILDKPRQTRFFDEEGHCFLSNWYEPEQGKCYRVHWFDRGGQLIRTFQSEKEMKLFWLNRLVQEEPTVILQSDDPKTSRLLLDADPRAVKVKMLHSNHLDEPYVYGAPVSKQNELALKQADGFDAFVVITEEQKRDIQRQFGMRTTFHDILHAVPRVEPDPHIQRDPWKAVVISRFVASKHCDHAIRAFQKVAERFPQARLELWGFGREEANLRELIRELGLQDHVFIQGATQDAQAVFQSAAFSLLPTEREAFGLVIAESLAAGAPVIAYDVNYGPRDLITHDVNGFLIQRDDLDGMSEAMITLFQDREKWAAMCREARNISENISEERFVRQWIQVYEEAVKQKQNRVQMKKPTCRITDFSWADPSTGTWRLEGEVVFRQEMERWREEVQMALYLRKRTEWIDGYFPAVIQWKDDHSIFFQSELTLAKWMEQSKTLRGRWDVYTSITVRNAHHFVRLGGTEENPPDTEVEVPNGIICPYYTEHGNLSLWCKKADQKKSLLSLLVGN
ncbi:glycosyltransferase [Kroppenstedtia eburnea]|uniref:glycosyltransferase n=1 Tax=Kroppenstedtia eburnea TaxID=714067 RepID=UPI00362A157A